MNNNIKVNELKCPHCDYILKIEFSYCNPGGWGGSEPSTGGSDEIPPQKMILEKIK